VYLVLLGRSIQHSYDTTIAGCTGDNCGNLLSVFRERYGPLLGITGLLLVVVPALIGIFWGAPLLTRELETGTHRLVWNQSVTRTRWLAVKLGFIALFTVLVTGLFSLLLTWAAAPFDRVVGSRFSPLTFDARDVAPLGYAVFAFVLGTTIGLVLRRTLPAMALTLVVFIAVQLLMGYGIREHLMSPVTNDVAFDTTVAEQVHGLGSTGGGGRDRGDSNPVGIFDFERPGDWVLTTPFLPLVNADGTAFTQAQMESCMTGDFEQDRACLTGQNLHFSMTYHPADRYWNFQWIETSIYLVLTLLLAGFCFWRLPKGLN
jgi:hypothetical protein